MEQLKRFGGILAICLFALPITTLAQSIGSPDSAFAVRIPGLTYQDRDALQLELIGRGDLKIVFACVPAGILVFEAAANETKQAAKQRTLPVLERKSLRARIEELDGGLATAETACESARNRQP